MLLPAEVPVMTLNQAILFPQAMLPLYIFEPRYRKMLKDAGGVPGYGNQRTEWDAGTRFDWENPEYR